MGKIRLLIIGILSMVSMTMFSERSEKAAKSGCDFFDEERVWEYTIHERWFEFRHVKFHFDGTVEKYGREYHVFKAFSNTEEIERVYENRLPLEYYVRAEDDKIYMLPYTAMTEGSAACEGLSAEEEILMYDFSENADTYEINTIFYHPKIEKYIRAKCVCQKTEDVYIVDGKEYPVYEMSYEEFLNTISFAKGFGPIKKGTLCYHDFSSLALSLFERQPMLHLTGIRYNTYRDTLGGYEWYYRPVNASPYNDGTSALVTLGTEKIDGHDYFWFPSHLTNFHSTSNEKMAIREESGIMYAYFHNSVADMQNQSVTHEPGEYVLYDFNTRPGDSFSTVVWIKEESHECVPLMAEMRVSEVFMVELLGRERRVLKTTVDNLDDTLSPSHNEFTIVEGLGIISGNGTLAEPFISLPEYCSLALRFEGVGEIDGKMISAETIDNLVRSSYIKQLQVDSASESSVPVYYYNLQGQRVMSPRPGDLLIRQTSGKTEKIIF